MSTLHAAPSYTDLALSALRRFPDNVAFVHRGRAITYAEVEARVSQLAQVLRSAGVGHGDGVVALTGNVPEYMYLLLAVTSLGAHNSALHPLGSADDHAFIIEDAEAKVFIYNGELYDEHAGAVLDRVGSEVRALSLGRSAHAPDLLAAADDEPVTRVRSVATAEDIVTIGYSSGTTGQPKGVVQHHRSAVEMTYLSMPGWQLPTSDFRYLAASPISHASGVFIVPTWIQGGTVFLQDGFAPDEFLRAIEEHRITCTFVVPTMLYVLLDHPGLSEHDYSSLQNIVYGASPMSPARLAEAMKVFGSVFVQLYGQAEAPACVTALRKEEHDLDRPSLLSSCGKPLPGVTVELHDDDDREVAPGEVGEICVRGRLVSEGYWKRPELTAETFRNDWLHTGDMATMDDDGYLHIVDRKKDMIITGGMNIFPREVEDVLTSHPSVAMAAVIGTPDDKWGEAITAIVVLKPGETVSVDHLSSLVRERKGPVYVPKVIEFADTIPLTGIAKPDKKALRARYWNADGRQVH